MKTKPSGQLLIEVVLNLALLVLILGIVVMFLSVFLSSQKYSGFNQAVAVSGFERYRNALISISQNNWSLLDSLSSTTDYYLLASGNQWVIATGWENIISFNERYSFSFRVGNYFNALVCEPRPL